MLDADSDAMSVVDYQLGSFDVSSLWFGDRLEISRLPADVKLVVDPDAGPTDLVGNPISWWIFSRRFADAIAPVAARDWEVLDAPLFGNDGQPVTGYVIANPTLRVKCLDLERSIVLRRTTGEISAVVEPVFREAALLNPPGLFRADEFPADVYVSDALAQTLRGKHFRGLAFQKCRVEQSD